MSNKKAPAYDNRGRICTPIYRKGAGMSLTDVERGGAETAAKQPSAPRITHNPPEAKSQGVCVAIIP